MTTNELFELITSEPKWWVCKLNESAASKIKRKHLEGRYTNYEWLFKKFGYNKTPDNWESIQSNA